MADTLTTNYGFTQPAVGGSDDTWGTKLNDNWGAADTQIKNREDEAAAAQSTADQAVSDAAAAQSTADTAQSTADTALSTANTADEHKVPTGGIIMWSGLIGDIPSGWALCDGANGTPDLRDRFVIGAGGSRNPDATGGAEQETTSTDGDHSHFISLTTSGHTLALSQIPNRTGKFESEVSAAGESDTIDNATGVFSINNNAGSTGAISKGTGGTSSMDRVDFDLGGGGGSHSHGLSGNSNSNGAHSHSVSTMSPWYALAFIMKL